MPTAPGGNSRRLPATQHPPPSIRPSVRHLSVHPSVRRPPAIINHPCTTPSPMIQGRAEREKLQGAGNTSGGPCGSPGVPAIRRQVRGAEAGRAVGSAGEGAEGPRRRSRCHSAGGGGRPRGEAPGSGQPPRSSSPPGPADQAPEPRQPWFHYCHDIFDSCVCRLESRG